MTQRPTRHVGTLVVYGAACEALAAINHTTNGAVDRTVALSVIGALAIIVAACMLAVSYRRDDARNEE